MERPKGKITTIKGVIAPQVMEKQAHWCFEKFGTMRNHKTRSITRMCSDQICSETKWRSVFGQHHINISKIPIKTLHMNLSVRDVISAPQHSNWFIIIDLKEAFHFMQPKRATKRKRH